MVRGPHNFSGAPVAHPAPTKFGTEVVIVTYSSHASDVQFGTEFFLYHFLVTNRSCSTFVPVYGTSFLVAYQIFEPISGKCVMVITVLNRPEELRP